MKNKFFENKKKTNLFIFENIIFNEFPLKFHFLVY